MTNTKQPHPFKATRKTLVTKLRSTSHTLHAEPTNLPTVRTTTIPSLLSLTETLHTDAEFEERITDTSLPLCFRPRVRQIQHELEWTATVLAANPNPSFASYAAVVLDMLALQVGRLVVDGGSDEDEFAAEMEAKVCAYDDGVRGRVPCVDGDAELRERQMGVVWERLNAAVEGCGCFQCTWRFCG